MPKKKKADTTLMELLVKRSLLSKSKLATITRGEEGETQYTCVECSAQYSDKEKLELHLYTHYNCYRHLCGVCGTGLKRKEHLERHMAEHTEYRPHICPECGKGFKRKEHLNIHSAIHSGDKKLSCTLCDKTFYRKDHLQKHVQTHNKQFMEHNLLNMSDNEITIKQEVEEFDEFPIITNVIGNADSESSMEVPMAVDSTRPFVCTTCGKSYKRKDHLKIHSWTHKEKEVLCGQCGKAFHTTDQMLVHVNLVHLRMHESSQDGVAKLQALLGDQIDIEVLTQTPDLLVPKPKKDMKDSRPHECPICHRKFKRKQHLKIHNNVHLKRPGSVWCPQCNEGFTDNEQYEKHQCDWAVPDNSYIENEDYPQTEESPTQDAKKENNPFDFVEVVVDEPASEEWSVEAEQRIPAPRRVYVCKYCGKPFKRKDHYNIHLHIHTGVKSFFCPDCGKGFYRKDHLQKHMIVHAKVKIKAKLKSTRQPPPLYPIRSVPRESSPGGPREPRKQIKPEITIHAPSNSKLRVPLQIKVPYQMVMSMDNGEQRAVTIDPQDMPLVL